MIFIRKLKNINYIVLGIVLGTVVLLCLTLVSSKIFNKSENGLTAELMHIVVTHDDGTTDYYDSNMIGKTRKNDIILASVQLPANPHDGNYSLFSSAYNNVVTVRFQEQILFSYGEEAYKNGNQIGNVFICADIPDEAWGDIIEIELKNVDYSTVESIMPIEIYRSSERNMYLLNGTKVIYYMSIMFLVACGIALIPLMFWKHNDLLRNRGLVLILFIASTMMWSMGYQRLFFITEGNSPLICNLEYVGISMSSPSFCLFMFETETGKRIKKILSIELNFFLILFVACALLNSFTVNFHYCRTLPLIHISIIIVLLTVVIYFIIESSPKDQYAKSFRTGTIVFTMFVLVDMVAYYLKTNGIISESIALIPFGLFAYLLILSVSYINYIVEFMISFKDKERLQKLAYTDGMTGVSNRRACLDQIEKLNTVSSYGIVFVDVNNLKLANDKYSHDEGDKLICLMAESLSSSFGNKCFIGRYGGDEFIICLESAKDIRNEIDKKINSFQNILREVNDKHIFPFEVSAACGYALSNENPGKNADEILGIADYNMYENKKKMKEKK
ncbi:MAG: diguanylate cyclase domain-containing protein [Oscillospiraceae bacterium]|nr:diguanylate cyclase [Oscillospiraceae bacterium]